MAQIAKNDVEKTTTEAADNVAELGRQFAGMTREATDKVEDTARGGYEAAQRTVTTTTEVERAVAHRSAAGMAEVNQAFAELATAQTRNNLEAFRALTHTVDWQAVTRIQGELVRASLERAADFSRRYVEVLQAVMSTAASAVREQSRKAA